MGTRWASSGRAGGGQWTLGLLVLPLGHLQGPVDGSPRLGHPQGPMEKAVLPRKSHSIPLIENVPVIGSHLIL